MGVSCRWRLGQDKQTVTCPWSPCGEGWPATTVGAAFAVELPALARRPISRSTGPVLSARVDNRARVAVRQCYHSVSARFAGRRLPVGLSTTTVEVFDGAAVVARHERATGRSVEVLTLHHHL